MKPRYFAGAVAVCALTIVGAHAQTNSPPVNPPSNPPSNTSATPLPGANSFTEGEARSRIEGKGFSRVTDLKKDDQGIWRGNAISSGKPVKVALDYKGNVFSD